LTKTPRALVTTHRRVGTAPTTTTASSVAAPPSHAPSLPSRWVHKREERRGLGETGEVAAKWGRRGTAPGSSSLISGCGNPSGPKKWRQHRVPRFPARAASRARAGLVRKTTSRGVAWRASKRPHFAASRPGSVSHPGHRTGLPAPRGPS
jgi:hypothetical protein